jgi:hypothetical protein
VRVQGWISHSASFLFREQKYSMQKAYS